MPLESFFNPSGCAVVGASRRPDRAGHQILRNLEQNGYQGALWAVNPRGEGVGPTPGYRQLAAIPGPVELVVMATPAQATPAVVDDLACRQRRVGDIKALVVVAAGFRETGQEQGAAWQDLLIARCHELGIRVLGPNCVGVISTHSGVNTTFILTDPPQEGGISFLSQSGAVGAWLIEEWSSPPCPLGFSKFISVGNMADVDLLEALNYLAEDETTNVVGLYLEGYAQGRALAQALGRVARKKPVVVLKVGRTGAGAQAAHSHTGSLAGSDRIYDGVLRQQGVRRVETIEELSDTMWAFDRLPLPQGGRTFLMTQAGGPGIYCADIIAESRHLSWAQVTGPTQKQLEGAMPPFASISRPVGHADITAQASANQHGLGAELILADEMTDALILVTVPVMFVPPTAIAQQLIQAQDRLQAAGIHKPLLPVLLAGTVVHDGRRALSEAGMVPLATPDRAARALNHLAGYAEFLRAGKEVTGGV